MPGPNHPFGTPGGNSPGSWPKQVKFAVRAEPGRAVLLGLLVVLLLGLWGRLLWSNRVPAEAMAQRLAGGTLALGSDNSSSYAPPSVQSGLSIAEWARQPVGKLTRNFFTVPYDYYPLDPKHAADEPTHNDSANSPSTQADQLKERQILVANVQEQAASLSLDGIVMGPNPQASLNGQLLGVGQDIGSTGFRILRIEPTRVIVESRGVKIQLTMK